VFEERDRATDEIKWTATRVDLRLRFKLPAPGNRGSLYLAKPRSVAFLGSRGPDRALSDSASVLVAEVTELGHAKNAAMAERVGESIMNQMWHRSVHMVSRYIREGTCSARTALGSLGSNYELNVMARMICKCGICGG
jgi:hypothetical protein